MINKVFSKKINELLEIDQSLRKNNSFNTREGRKIDKKNLMELKLLIKEFGFPTIESVGKRSYKNAWIIIQHSLDLNFQKKMLKVYEEYNSSNPNIKTMQFIAYLKDRILIREVKKQKFGTQFKILKSGKMVPYPFINNKVVKRLREQYGLEPLEDYLKLADDENKKNNL